MFDSPPIDPRSFLLLAALLTLLNAGLLWVLRQSLAAELRPSASSWCVAAALQAAGLLLLAGQGSSPPAWWLACANACLILGATGYLGALRQFYGQPKHGLMYLPTLLGAAGVWFFADVVPDLGGRIVVVAVILSALSIASAMTLKDLGPDWPGLSRRLLHAALMTMGLLLLLRAALILGYPPEASSLLQVADLAAVQLVVLVMLPVMGTSAFLAMCSERMRLQWERAASTDQLTGLANRRTFLQITRAWLDSAKAGGPSLALLLIDIDHFKALNDRFGHAAGDAALRQLGAQLIALQTPRRVAARLGGEEFGVICRGHSQAEAVALAAQLQNDLFLRPTQWQQHSLSTAVSIGIALLQPQSDDLDALLGRADQALYAAKRAGRNRVEIAPVSAGQSAPDWAPHAASVEPA